MLPLILESQAEGRPHARVGPDPWRSRPEAPLTVLGGPGYADTETHVDPVVAGSSVRVVLASVTVDA